MLFLISRVIFSFTGPIKYKQAKTMTLKVKTVLLAAIIICVFTASEKVSAEAIYTNEETVIYGKIIYQDRDKIEVKNRYGKIVIQKKTIKKIQRRARSN